jgi:hypothetical protein
MNFDRLRFVAERAALGEGLEALLSVDIPERPGRYVTRAPIFYHLPHLTTFSVFSRFTPSYTPALSRNSLIDTTPLIAHMYSCHFSSRLTRARRRWRASLPSFGVTE